MSHMLTVKPGKMKTAFGTKFKRWSREVYIGHGLVFVSRFHCITMNINYLTFQLVKDQKSAAASSSYTDDGGYVSSKKRTAHKGNKVSFNPRRTSCAKKVACCI